MVSQGQFSVNLHNWNTLEDHWKTTESTLETHWLPKILSPVAFQCTLRSKFQAHGIATELPLAQVKGIREGSMDDVQRFDAFNGLCPVPDIISRDAINFLQNGYLIKKGSAICLFTVNIVIQNVRYRGLNALCSIAMLHSVFNRFMLMDYGVINNMCELQMWLICVYGCESKHLYMRTS